MNVVIYWKRSGSNRGLFESTVPSFSCSWWGETTKNLEVASHGSVIEHKTPPHCEFKHIGSCRLQLSAVFVLSMLKMFSITHLHTKKILGSYKFGHVANYAPACNWSLKWKSVLAFVSLLYWDQIRAEFGEHWQNIRDADRWRAHVSSICVFTTVFWICLSLNCKRLR